MRRKLLRKPGPGSTRKTGSSSPKKALRSSSSSSSLLKKNKKIAKQASSKQSRRTRQQVGSKLNKSKTRPNKKESDDGESQSSADEDEYESDLSHSLSSYGSESENESSLGSNLEENEDDDLYDDEDSIETKKFKLTARGARKKRIESDTDESENENEAVDEKGDTAKEIESDEQPEAETASPKKKGRGRPRKSTTGAEPKTNKSTSRANNNGASLINPYDAPNKYVELNSLGKHLWLNTYERNYLIFNNEVNSSKFDPESLHVPKKILPVLPKVNIELMEEFPSCFAEFALPPNFIKFNEKTSDELDDEIEYDMDEEDNVWLKLINEQRSSSDPPQSEVTQDQFELLMDRLEKECHFQQSTAAITASTAHNSSNNTSLNSSLNDSKTHPDTTSEDALCCICLDGECVNSNVILFCDMCNLAVHQECYGVPYIPEGQWLCRRCIQSPSTPVTCLLCPNVHGAFKQTERGQWAHVVCAIWVPEVHFANTVFLEPIIGIENIDKARWKLTCYICRKRGSGACIQCDKHNCYTAFHVTCAQSAGLYMNIKEEIVELDETQTNQKKKKGRPSSNQNANNSSLAEVRKQAFCDIHTPLDVLSPRTQKQLGITDGGHVGLNHVDCEEAMKKAQKQRMKRARKILAAKQNSSPTVCLPVIPKEKINEIMNKLADEDIDEKEAFFGKLMNYWLLKRYSRNGVPLLRRLQHSASLRKHIQYQANSRNQQNSSKNEDALNDSSNSDHHSTKSASTKQNSIQEQLSYWKKLRQDLERARLLMELVRKRERIKRDLVRLHQLETAYEINPFYGVFLQRLLDLLIELDKSNFFYEPVNPVEAPDYYDEIKEPMCFREMQAKLDAGRYKNFEGFEYDYNLIVSNCLQFNPKGTVFYKAAFKLREQASSLIKQAKRMYDNVGFDEWVDKSEEALSAIKKEIKMMNCKKAGKMTASEKHDEAHVDNSTAATNSNDTSFNTTEEA